VLHIVKIRVYGHLKSHIGQGSIDIDLGTEKKNLKVVLKMINELFPTISLLSEENRNIISQDYLILVNGIDVRVFDDISEIYIENDDEIDIIPITHGGIYNNDHFNTDTMRL